MISTILCTRLWPLIIVNVKIFITYSPKIVNINPKSISLLIFFLNQTFRNKCVSYSQLWKIIVNIFFIIFKPIPVFSSFSLLAQKLVNSDNNISIRWYHEITITIFASKVSSNSSLTPWLLIKLSIKPGQYLSVISLVIISCTVKMLSTLVVGILLVGASTGFRLGGQRTCRVVFWWVHDSEDVCGFLIIV